MLELHAAALRAYDQVIGLELADVPADGCMTKAQDKQHLGTATEIPGTGTLNADGDAAVFSVSCPAAGNCAAGGFYKDGAGHTQAFVAGETNGSWGKAIEVPGSGEVDQADHGKIATVSESSCHQDAGKVIGPAWLSTARPGSGPEHLVPKYRRPVPPGYGYRDLPRSASRL